MGIVTFIVDAADSSLNSIAESQFAAVESTMGTVILLMSTLALVLLFANMLLQMRPIDAADLFHIIIKIGLINAFAFNWVNFNYVSGSITAGLDNIAGVVIGSITGETGSGAVFFAERFDQLTEELSDYANQMGQQMNWMAGAMMSVLLTVLIAVLSGAAALMLVLSKMVVTLLIGLAPVMITLTLFKATQDYFNRWLSSLIAWSLYPIIIAGVFSVIFGLLNLLQAAIGDASEVVTIGVAMPFLAMIFLALVLIGFIPAIVRTLSGDINSGLAGSMTGGIGRRAYQQTLGLASRPQPQQVQQAQLSPRDLRPNPSAPPPRQDTGAGARALRAQARTDRLRGKK